MGSLRFGFGATEGFFIFYTGLNKSTKPAYVTKFYEKLGRISYKGEKNYRLDSDSRTFFREVQRFDKEVSREKLGYVK